MAKLERSELLKIAELSALQLDEEEIAAFIPELQKVLDYTDQLSQVKLGDERKPARNINLFRNDTIRSADEDHAAELPKNAPESHDNYFVVPKIVD